MTATVSTPVAEGSVIRTLRLGVSRAVYETKLYFRQGDTIFFTFLFPIVLLAIFSVAFSGMGDIGAAPDGTGGISQGAFYLPGMIAAGILLSGVQNLAVDIATERSDGTLKRLGGSPLPVLSYFIGKFGQVLATSLLQLALLLLVARFAFDVALPTDADKWLTLAWVYLLGISTSAVLGIALSRVPRTGKSATAVIITVPSNTAVPFLQNTNFSIEQAGAGAVSFAAGAGVTINKPTGKQAQIAGQFGARSW